jgi:putative hydrolase of the HAD superfamily
LIKNKKHIFFDLDRTIWDFDKNAKETIFELYDDLELRKKGIDSPLIFFEAYEKINDWCWYEYRIGRLAKHELRTIRFEKTLEEFFITDVVLADRLGTNYLKICPLKKNLIKDAHFVLSSLVKKYTLHIITNGFDEIQHIKLQTCDLKKYFSEIITSERAKSKKPFKAIFDFSLQLTNANIEESVMIGDDYEADINGASLIGMDSIWFNEKGQKKSPLKNSREIKSLKELLPMFLD